MPVKKDYKPYRTWHAHLMQTYRSNNVSFSEAMKLASSTYRSSDDPSDSYRAERGSVSFGADHQLFVFGTNLSFVKMPDITVVHGRAEGDALKKTLLTAYVAFYSFSGNPPKVINHFFRDKKTNQLRTAYDVAELVLEAVDVGDSKQTRVELTKSAKDINEKLQTHARNRLRRAGGVPLTKGVLSSLAGRDTTERDAEEMLRVFATEDASPLQVMGIAFAMDDYWDFPIPKPAVDELTIEWSKQPGGKWSESAIAEWLFKSQSRTPGPRQWAHAMRTYLYVNSVGMNEYEWKNYKYATPDETKRVASKANGFTWTQSDGSMEQAMAEQAAKREKKAAKRARKLFYC